MLRNGGFKHSGTARHSKVPKLFSASAVALTALIGVALWQVLPSLAVSQSIANIMPTTNLGSNAFSQNLNGNIGILAAPTVANPIPDQFAIENAAFDFQFAANMFTDTDGDTLTYSTQMAGGGALPAWLSFDPATRTFSGTPSNGDVGTISIDLIADDGNGGTITDTFNIEVRTEGSFTGTGDGLDEGTAYIITTCAQLQEMAYNLNAWYRLGNNIDCSGTTSWNSGAGFEPVGSPGTPFYGVLRGANRTVSGLTINRPGTDHVGLFGYIGGAGSVDKLRLNNVSITGRDYTAPIAGETVNGDVFNTSTSGSVTGAWWTAGLVGKNGGMIINTNSQTSVNSVASRTGGLVGENAGGIQSSYSRGFVQNAPATGGLVGYSSGGQVTNSFWNTQTSGQATSAAGTGKTTAELKEVATFTDTETTGLDTAWDFVDDLNDDVATDGMWNINPRINQGYPYLTNQTPGVPETFITDAPQSPKNTAGLYFEFASDVEPATFECKVDRPNGVGSYQPCSESHTSSTSEDGSYTFSVRATNLDGVEDTTPAQSTIIIDTAELDTDGDGVRDQEELAAPNNGDANGDGTADSQQPNVASFMNTVTNQYTVLETDCESLSNIQIGGESSEQPDTGFSYPGGLTAFHATCASSGDTARIRQYYYGIEGSNKFHVRKWLNDGSYTDIPGYNLYGQLIDGDVIFLAEYSITDGSQYDDDGLENGVIVDPSGIARVVAINGGANNSAGNGTEELADTGSSVMVTVLVATGLASMSLLLFAGVSRAQIDRE